MIDSILAVIVLIIAGWAIAKNYDAKVVLFIAALVLLYSGLLLGHNVLGAKATTGLSWVDPFKVIKDQFVRQYSNAGLIILTLFGFAAYIVNFQRFPTLDAKKLVNAPKMSAHHRGICHF